jgi:hypothetical protein
MIRIQLTRILRVLALTLGLIVLAPAFAEAQSPFYYTFNSPGTLYEAASPDQSTSPYFWLASGAKLEITNGIGETVQGSLPLTDFWHRVYALQAAISSDDGAHPQNTFRLFTKDKAQDVSASVSFDRTADNVTNPVNRHPYNGESLIARYQDENNYYYAGVRADGLAVIKKKVGGTYETLATKKIFAGAYDPILHPDLIPKNTWIGLKLDVANNASGAPALTLSTDVGLTGTWTKVLGVTDSGKTITGSGLTGIENDYGDAKFDNFSVANGSDGGGTNYDSSVLADGPAMFLGMSSGASGSEKDLTGNGHTATYRGGTPGTATLPNGDTVADFNGSSEYASVSSSADLSIPKTGQLTYEAWIRPDTLAFPNQSGDAYVDWIGKCADYSPTCEWEGRMYSDSTPEGRGDRLSGYVFNPSAGLGSAADWQPDPGIIKAGQWLHVVVEYQTKTTPAECNARYPGTITIWVNGVPQSFKDHAPTGCMSQYKITPAAKSSPLLIGTMAMDTWFKGAIGKVAVYDHLLSQSEIDAHFTAMTGKTPSGSCGETCHF